jgi:hypothetical protein
MCDLSIVFTDAFAIRQPRLRIPGISTKLVLVITEKLVAVDDWLTPDRMSSMPQRSVEA